MRFSFNLLLFSVLSLFLAGCAEFKAVTVEDWPSENVEMNDELAELYRVVAKKSGVVTMLDGYADIWIKTTRRQERVYSNIQLKRSEDMRIIVSSGVMGLPVADMLFRPDSMFVHDMLNNLLLVGANNPGNIEKVLGLRTGYRLLSDALSGIVSVEEPLRAVESVRKGDGKVSYTIATSAGKKQLLVNSATRNMEGLLVSDRYGRKQVQIHFRNFAPFVLKGENVNLPGQIDVLLFNPRIDGGGKHEMVIEYDERTINPDVLEIDYRVPVKARVIELEKVVDVLPWM